VTPQPFYDQPDPAQEYYVQPKAEKLVRRGPREYYIIARKRDGSRIEVRLLGARLQMEGP
jgi:hypothetical protein